MPKTLRFIAAILAATAALLLGACVDVEQDVWIYEDGSGRVVIKQGLSKQMMEMMSGIGESIGEGLGESLGSEAAGEVAAATDLFNKKEVEASIKANPNVKSVKVSEEKGDEFTYLVADVELKDITKVHEIMKIIDEDGPDTSSAGGGGGDEPGGEEDEEGGGEPQVTFNITKTDSGTYKVSGSVKPAPGESADEMPAGMLGGAAFTYRVHAKAVDHNGDKKKGAIVWTIPLGDVMGGKELSMEGEFEPGKPPSGGLALWITLAAVVAVAAIVFVVLRSQKPKAAPAPPAAPAA